MAGAAEADHHACRRGRCAGSELDAIVSAVSTEVDAGPSPEGTALVAALDQADNAALRTPSPLRDRACRAAGPAAVRRTVRKTLTRRPGPVRVGAPDGGAHRVGRDELADVGGLGVAPCPPMGHRAAPGRSRAGTGSGTQRRRRGPRTPDGTARRGHRVARLPRTHDRQIRSGAADVPRAHRQHRRGRRQVRRAYRQRSPFGDGARRRVRSRRG